MVLNLPVSEKDFQHQNRTKTTIQTLAGCSGPSGLRGTVYAPLLPILLCELCVNSVQNIEEASELSEPYKLSEKEFTDMLKALKKHVETDMDQWEIWKLDTARGKIFINISLASEGEEDTYIDLNRLLK
ncbi:hypothetical protein FIU95_14685 [Microbulbifer sp. THAF38]|nr:hypothetical protein FIU95_14685 [Microbulbifer sp. THAF38]